ncbi:MAG TPA: peptide ABC transporter substrate-binding protein [Candidatus Eremiobacteraceae bacterium]|nr:peptide ABC transporter substrate-binding protein [Candidatus Eremiobacteraceae bacterium]
MGDAITTPARTRRILALSCGVLALSALASCTKISQSTTPPNAGHSIPGTLRYADIEEPISFNPLLRTIAVATDMDMFIFGFFYNFDDKMRFVPELATVVPTYANGGISKDGLTITYHLRRGVKWHDGAPFTSHDVVFTVHAILNPDNNLSLRTGWDQIGSVEALDDHTVRFHLKRIYAPAISTYFAEGGLYPVLPAHLLEKYANINQVPFNSDPIGTGPFKFVKWVHGDRVELEANPNYWRGPPKLKRIIYKVIPNDVTILNQLRTHEIDAWFRAAVSLYPQIRELPTDGFRVELAPSLVYSHIDLNQKNPIFQDLRVRQAMAHAIDRATILHNITYDVHVVGYADLPPFSWAYEPDVAHYDYDPAKARQLLDAAGWVMGPDGVRVKNGQRLAFNLAAAAGGKTGEAVEQYLQADFKNIGIEANIKNYPTALYFDNYARGGILQAGKYDAAWFSWVAGADPGSDESIYTSYSIPPAGQNNLWWSDPVLDRAERGALSSYDQRVRKKYYSIVQKEIAGQAVTIVVFFQRQIFITADGFQNFKPAPATTSNWNTWEWEMK